ncbi:tetratricopeptide repeat family protein, putative [Babesia microti strain RI]|uniref:peptidylprolyl isomerase n=1 Tax=Babesia microti (strain RI) TaxID=1133968 RepID=A0A1R4AA07_BABMR|nr:tetratricopeptide repeat family protein, putative [Babesia microti strain RI]SJK85820.1 tetratricopeptide repeat family protein, putative [Babesia microti strain RI]|eukprot:XP_012647887.2 tetratricopeptide repeat family protein, putative [Babesia microti strain RI]
MTSNEIDNIDEGKKFYLRGDYSAAINRWEISIKSVEYILNSMHIDDSLAEKKRHFKLKRIELLSNIALAYLKMGNYNKTITLCLKVLQLDKSNEKAFLRISKAHLLSGDYSNAIKYANMGYNVYPNESTFIKIITEAKRMRIYSDAKEVKMYRNMLGICQDYDNHPCPKHFCIAFTRLASKLHMWIVTNYTIIKSALVFSQRKLQNFVLSTSFNQYLKQLYTFMVHKFK